MAQPGLCRRAKAYTNTTIAMREAGEAEQREQVVKRPVPAGPVRRCGCADRGDQGEAAARVPVARARRRSITSARAIWIRPWTRGLSRVVPSKSPAEAKIPTGTVSAWKKAKS